MKELIKKLIPGFVLSQYHLLLAFWGCLFYRFPSKKLKVIGLTGTKGKTTAVEMTKAILEEAGQKTASISSLRFTIGRKEWPNELKMTMPGRFKLQKFLRKAVKEKCQYAVFEVTSEGILQHRHRFIDFDTVVFTNLSSEHIERHGSFEKYREAKGQLFNSSKNIHILNLDDKNAGYFLKFPAKEKWGYSIGTENKNPEAKIKKVVSNIKRENLIQGERVKADSQGVYFSVQGLPFNLSLIGEFNVFNALCAITIARAQGIGLEVCRRALEKIGVLAGRMEMVIKQPFKILVDYAHTPDSLEKVYETITGQIIAKPANQLICLLGSAGGGRDKWKRPEMGRIAAKYCDKIIITNEDPYDEDPESIINQVAEGVGEKAIKILDRREAIRKALVLAKPGDAVVLTGKGSECWMCLKRGKKIPWNEKKVVQEEYRKISGPAKP